MEKDCYLWFMEKKDRIVAFLNSRPLLKPTGIERVLGLPKRSIILSKGILPIKHLDKIEALLVNYGYSTDVGAVCLRQDVLQNGEEYVLGDEYRIQEKMKNSLWRTMDEFHGKKINI